MSLSKSICLNETVTKLPDFLNTFFLILCNVTGANIEHKTHIATIFPEPKLY